MEKEEIEGPRYWSASGTYTNTLADQKPDGFSPLLKKRKPKKQKGKNQVSVISRLLFFF